MARLLMLDSGAFSVWKGGGKVDLGEYISFCLRYPRVSYYVSLDVIPGKPSDKRSLSKASVEEACLQGWKNYRRMIRELPKDKVIPVFHQHDGIHLLQKYLDFGVPYLGISPANDVEKKGRARWLRSLRPYLFDGAGRPTVKTHGFAVTSLALMNYMQWHSVDSAAWQFTASMGNVWIPKRTRGEFDFSKSPHTLGVSLKSPSRNRYAWHLDNVPPTLRRDMLEFIDLLGIPLGKTKIRKETPSYKLKDGEFWHDKKKGEVTEVLELGLSNSREERMQATAEFVRRVARVVSVDHLYLAGLGVNRPWEFNLETRLLSYNYVKDRSGDRKCFLGHLKRIKKEVQNESPTRVSTTGS